LNELEPPFYNASKRPSRASTATFCQDVNVVVLRPLIKLAMPPTPQRIVIITLILILIAITAIIEYILANYYKPTGI
jgi:hypothetical protein